MKEITVVFSEEEIKSLVSMLDVFVRTNGVKAVHAVARIDVLLGDAMRAAAAIETAPPQPMKRPRRRKAPSAE